MVWAIIDEFEEERRSKYSIFNVKWMESGSEIHCFGMFFEPFHNILFSNFPPMLKDFDFVAPKKIL